MTAALVPFVSYESAHLLINEYIIRCQKTHLNVLRDTTKQVSSYLLSVLRCVCCVVGMLGVLVPDAFCEEKWYGGRDKQSLTQRERGEGERGGREKESETGRRRRRKERERGRDMQRQRERQTER